LDLETHRELEELKACVIMRHQQLRCEELHLTFTNADRRDKETRLKIANELKALQFTTSINSPSVSLPLEEIQSRVDVVLMRLEDREGDLLIQHNDSISSSLCELSRRSFLQVLRHFKCGLTLPNAGQSEVVDSEVGIWETGMEGVGLQVCFSSFLTSDPFPIFCHS
jgi:hypothetical protein